MGRAWTLNRATLALTTKKLGDVRSGTGLKIGQKSVNDGLLLRDRVPHLWHVRRDINRHGIGRVLGREQGIGSVLGVGYTNGTSTPLPQRLENGVCDDPIGGRKAAAGRTRRYTRKRVSRARNRDNLGFCEHGEGALCMMGHSKRFPGWVYLWDCCLRQQLGAPGDSQGRQYGPLPVSITVRV